MTQMSTRYTNCLFLFFFSFAVNHTILLSQVTCPNPSFSFGLIADCQCGSATCQSKDRLQECVDYFNQENIEFLGHLGDFIQSDFSNFSVVLPIIQQSTAPVKFALGNHDYDIPDSEKPNLPTLLQMPDFYYDEVIENWRFIYLETTETGPYAQAAHPNVTACGVAGLSSTQLTWVSQRIQLAEQNDENVILFGHHPHEFLCNGNDLRTILEGSPNVVAYMTGHRHIGNYEMLNHVHYLTLTSMLNRTESTYSEITISNDSILVTGFGDQPDFALTYTIAASFDQDNDGVCDDVDQCPNFDDNLIGQACDDNDPCTTGETYDLNCNCSGGSFLDMDNDNICDANDTCPNFDNNLIGQTCDDNDPCTTGETYDVSCNCSGGTLVDQDNDGVCDSSDQCPGLNDILIGQTCNDNDPCTVGDIYDTNCICAGSQSPDSDNDGVCDIMDQCPGFDDMFDTNNNGLPDYCEMTPLSPCSSVIFLSGTESFYHHQVSNRIFSRQLVDGFFVKYSAENQIDILTEFEVKLGTVFEAQIEDCQ